MKDRDGKEVDEAPVTDGVFKDLTYEWPPKAVPYLLLILQGMAGPPLSTSYFSSF